MTSDTNPIDSSVEYIAQRVADLLDELLSFPRALAEQVLDLHDDLLDTAPGSPLTDRALRTLAPSLTAELAREPRAYGVGFVAAPGVVDDHTRYLFWLQRRGTQIGRLDLNFDAKDVDMYDYLEMDWYARAFRTKHSAAQGPYVDYSGSGEFVFTMVTPVMRDEEFLGVTGVDALFRLVEPGLQAILRGTSAAAVIVDSERRILATNTPRWLPGERTSWAPSEALSAQEKVQTAAVGGGTDWFIAIVGD